MKRVLMMAVAVSCVASLALAADVTSVNIVGYSKGTVTPGMQIIAPMFNSGVCHLEDIVGTNGVAGSTRDNSDNAWVYNAASHTWKFLYLLSAPGFPDYDRKFFDDDLGDVATNVLLSGDGFWYLSRLTTNLTLTMMGEAFNEPAVTNVIVPGMQVLGYVYSCDRPVTSLSFTNGVAGSTRDNSDNMWVYNAASGSWKFLYLLSAPGFPDYDRKWFDDDLGDVSTNVIRAGTGFWFLSRSLTNINWIETRPY